MSQSNTTDSVNELGVAGALTWRYVIALSLVATLSTAAWVSLHLVISEQKSTAAVVNVSGRQRMLSQRTAMFSNLLLNTPKAERSLIRGKLKDAIDLMARSHRGLTHGDNEMGLPETMSLTVRSIYFDEPIALDRQVETYIKNVQALLLLDDNALTPENPLLQYITEVAPTTLVSALDQMVRQYQLEGEASVGHLQKAETIFWMLTLLLLTLEALLIFHPFVRHVKTIIGKLQRVTGDLQLHQSHLEELVKQRTAEIRKLNASLERRVTERTVQLEAANKELEAFSYSVSHDLRTPLRAIDGFSHILLDDYADKLDDEGKRLLNVVRDNTRRMGQLIDDILKFSRTNRLEMAYAEIDMEGLARSVVEELLPVVAAGHKLQIEIEHIPSTMGDRALMHQVFVNLLSNAIKFSSSREDATIKVGGSIESDETVYFVRDNGVGFDMQYADKLFGVFQRLHGVSEFEGTGIGLAIVKRVIIRHGGRVWAEGKVGEGTTIYFALPAKKKEH
jgi:signal transduction histidine kinase